MPCPHPEDRSETLFPARDYVSGERFEIRRCGACGLARTWPVPPPERLGAYYPAEYYGSAGDRRFPGPVEKGQDLLYGWRAQKVERLCPGGPGRVLDVGCGRGLLLQAFQRRGWTVEGTELSAQSSRHAREVVGVPVHIGPLPSLGLPSDSFDAVTMWQVLEHVPDPHAFIAEVHRILKPGGVFFVSVPNFASVEARACRDGWFHLDVPRHLIHFTPDTLRASLAEAGFREIGSSSFAPEYDLFSAVQSTLNRLGLRQNLLYSLLRQRGAKLLEDGGLGQSLVTLALSVPLGVLGVPSTIVAGLLKQGAILSLYARKS
jgi:SAM-dependent methyltransferase